MFAMPTSKVVIMKQVRDLCGTSLTLMEENLYLLTLIWLTLWRKIDEPAIIISAISGGLLTR